ncbi:hydroxyaromatic non-oxidative decarboxylase protein C [Klebsiella pneumoniae]|uniref:Hydroxyaromatic non-oxidative decarboxylase protein C n=1 Tax=Klebsiella pneumoniae TaxID=573 RepID=A0A377WR24_KLEPN|nr:hydroxyaromatic non-oxidative decarboxylase protein C [Klebsiella pneumoniae]
MRPDASATVPRRCGFDNIRGFNDARVTMNTIGSWQNHAISLGLPPNTPVKKQIDEFIRRWDNFPVTPERRANPAWAENTVDGDDINLFDILPLFRLNDGDGGFYSIKPVSFRAIRWIKITSVSQNVGIYRMEVKGKRKLGLQPVPMHRYRAASAQSGRAWGRSADRHYPR